MSKSNFGKNLTRIRKEKDMTQQALAESLNVSNKTVSRWETGTCQPDLDIIGEISELFDVSVDDLLGNNKTKSKIKKKIGKKKLFLIIIVVLLVIFLLYYLYNNFTTKSYSLISGDERFSITGNITMAKNNYSLSLTVKGVNDETLRNTVITNFEYSVIICDRTIFKYGDMQITQILLETDYLSKIISNIKISHADEIKFNIKEFLKEGITLQIKYLDENNNENTIEIPILIDK